jgi:hypothetical protein
MGNLEAAKMAGDGHVMSTDVGVFWGGGSGVSMPNGQGWFGWRGNRCHFDRFCWALRPDAFKLRGVNGAGQRGERAPVGLWPAWGYVVLGRNCPTRSLRRFRGGVC